MKRLIHPSRLLMLLHARSSLLGSLPTHIARRDHHTATLTECYEIQPKDSVRAEGTVETPTSHTLGRLGSKRDIRAIPGLVTLILDLYRHNTLRWH